MNWPLVYAMSTVTGTVIAAALLSALWTVPDRRENDRLVWLGMACLLLVGPGIVLTVYWLAQAIVVAVRP